MAEYDEERQFYLARIRTHQRFTDRPYAPAIFPNGAVRGKYTWDNKVWFSALEDAIDAVLAIRRESAAGGLNKIEVQDEDGNVVWDERRGHITHYAVKIQAAIRFEDPQPQEEPMGYDEKQPLHVPRGDLIKTLQANLDTEIKRREDAVAAVKKTRKAAEAAVAKLSADELVNLITKYVGVGVSDISDMVDEAQESKRLVSPEIKETHKETELAKYVRVLSLANDETIEVTPTSEIYSLL